MLEARASGSHHFMGTIVVKGETDRLFTIIDGQQRFATMGILSLAVIKKLGQMAKQGIERNSNLQRAIELRNRFVGEKDPASLMEVSRLTLNHADDPFYQDYLVPLRNPTNPRGLSQSNALLWQCLSYFGQMLDKLEVAQGDGAKIAAILSEALARHTLFVLITVNDEPSAYTVFESLNARGIELTTADLLKNYLFSKVRVQSDLNALQRRWTGMISTVTAGRFSDFFGYHLLCERPQIRKAQLFKLVRDRVKIRSEVFDLLEALEERAELYSALGDANHGLWKERPEAKRCVQDLILFRTRQATPVLFAAWKKFSTEEFDRLLELIVVISFRFMVSKRSANELEIVYHQAARAVIEGRATRTGKVFRYLRKIYVDDRAFEDSFATYSINSKGNRKLLKYILCRIEDHLTGAIRKRDPETDPATIEHILPRNPSDKWAEEFAGNERYDAVDRIGNSTLLESSLNREIGSSSCGAKLPVIERARMS